MTFSSTGNTLEEIVQTLMILDKADCFPFPYADIRHIYKTVTSRKKLTRRLIEKGFGPDLNTFQMSVSGACGGYHFVLEWPAEKRQQWADWLNKSFFERWPEYLSVRRWITEANTPELFRDFVLHEEMRVNMLALLRLLDKLEGR